MGPWQLGVGRGLGREERAESCRGDGSASDHFSFPPWLHLPAHSNLSCFTDTSAKQRIPQPIRWISLRLWKNLMIYVIFVRIISQHPPQTVGPNRLLQAWQPLPGAASLFIVYPQELNRVS